MSTMLFEPWKLANVVAPNRLVRSATYEGMGDADGRPGEELGRLYARLAASGVGTVVTGFCFVSREGRAMQPRQCGIDRDEIIPDWERVVSAAKDAAPSCVLLMQIAHTGRQTLERATGSRVIAPTAKRSPYFRSRPVPMTDAKIGAVIEEFAAAARRAQQAGFDGVQVHAAHGYLVHQFLSPHLNDRSDRWGRDRLAFAREIIAGIKARCGDGFPVTVKMSVVDDDPGGMTPTLAADYAAGMHELGVEAVELSYGTMSLAMNIFRGGVPIDRVLEHNPLFCSKPRWLKALWRRFAWPSMRGRFVPFAEDYNREPAREVRRRTRVPRILVGGIRSLESMEDILASGDADAVAMCRPFICEPDLAAKLRSGTADRSRCTNCNTCAVMCDSAQSLRCAQRKETAPC